MDERNRRDNLPPCPCPALPLSCPVLGSLLLALLLPSPVNVNHKD